MLKLAKQTFAAATMIFIASAASAQSFPNRDLVFLCGFPPGSAPDIIVRYFADSLRPVVGRAIVVQNRAGAGGNIAAETLVRSKPDGHTVYLHAGSSITLNSLMIKGNTVDGTKIRFAATIHRNGFVIVVPNQSPVKSVAELAELVRNKAGKANFATTAPFGTLMGGVFKALSNIDATEVKFRLASDAGKEIESGQIDYGIFDPQNARRLKNAGIVRVLAISTSERMKVLDDIPTMRELGFDLEMNNWFAAMVPAATPDDIVLKINGWINKVLATEKSRMFLEGIGAEPWISTPEAAQARFASDVKTWAKYMEIAGLKPN